MRAGAEKGDGILIIGGGLAAARTAEQLRRAQFDGPITIVGAESHLPYDRPPLSKGVLHSGVDDVALKSAEFYEEKGISLRLGCAAVSVGVEARIVTLADGSTLGYDQLVIATGLVPKRILAFPDLQGICLLRTVDDARALRDLASSAHRAVIVGAGFIGCEVAASFRKLGLGVVLVEPQPAQGRLGRLHLAQRSWVSASGDSLPGCIARRASMSAPG